MGAQAILFEMLCPDAYIILSSVVSIHGILEYSYHKCKLSVCIIALLVGGGQWCMGRDPKWQCSHPFKEISFCYFRLFFLSFVFVIIQNQIHMTISVVSTLEFGMFMQDSRRGHISKALVFSSYDVIRLEYMCLLCVCD